MIFEILRMGSHDEKGATLVELWSLRKVKYPSLNLLCLVFQFSLYKNEKNVPVPLREVEAFYSFLIMFLSSSLEGFMGGQIIS